MARPRRQLDPQRLTDNRQGRAVALNAAALCVLFRPELEAFMAERRRVHAARKGRGQ